VTVAVDAVAEVSVQSTLAPLKLLLVVEFTQIGATFMSATISGRSKS